MKLKKAEKITCVDMGGMNELAKRYCETTIPTDETGDDVALIYNLRFMAFCAGWKAAQEKTAED